MADPWSIFFNRDLPVLQERLGRIAKALEGIAKALEELVEIKNIELGYQKRQAGYDSPGHGDD